MFGKEITQPLVSCTAFLLQAQARDSLIDSGEASKGPPDGQCEVRGQTLTLFLLNPLNDRLKRSTGGMDNY